MSFIIKGKVAYGPGIRVVAWVDQSLVDYYRKLIPKYMFVRPQAYPAHVTLVRTGRENPTDMTAWGKHEGEEIEITYDGEIKTDGKYYYLDVESERIAEIRIELGLLRYRIDDNKKYHVTIGNCKDID